MKLNRLLLFVVGVLFSISVLAKTPDPLVMMKTVSNKIMAKLKANRASLKRKPNLVIGYVDKIVVPHVDVVGMSRSVLGRHIWTTTSASQQKAFIQAFKRVVIGTYASALNAYTDETIKFFPIRGGYEGQSRIQVYSQVIRDDGPPVSMNYRLALIKGKWKIYDLNVEGISLLQSFHAQFAEKISKGQTLPQITRDLQRRKIKTSRDY